MLRVKLIEYSHCFSSLNVYDDRFDVHIQNCAADIKPNEKLAVMFWIHGGAFIGGSGNDNLYGPDFLVEKRIVVVTLNYRLGVFGFLTLQLPEYSGNMGLKDIQLALKWTHKNIERFGGDNKRITVFGHSAGKHIN